MGKKTFTARAAAWILALMLVFTMAPSIAFAETEDAGTPDTGTANMAPVLVEGVDPSVTASTTVGKAYNLRDLQLGNIFTDPEGEKLVYSANYFYQRSADGGENWSSEQSFPEALFGSTMISVSENQPGTYMYRFYARDNEGASSADEGVYWTLTLNVCEKGTMPCNTKFFVGRDAWYSANGGLYPELQVFRTAGTVSDRTSENYGFDYVGTYEKNGKVQYVFDPADYSISGDADTGYSISDGQGTYALNDYQPVIFTDSSFGEDSENASESGEIQNNYSMYYATVYDGWYSVRGYGHNADGNRVKLGGMKIQLPADGNVDGNAGGGCNIYLRLSEVYTGSKKLDNTYFGASDYYAAVTCPIMECNPQPGEPYISGNYTKYPFLLYAGGNSCLYNRYVYPVSEDYTFTQAINATVATGYTPNTTFTAMTIAAAMKLEVTVPKDTDFGLYFQWNNFNSTQVAPVPAEDGKTWTDNGDGTKTAEYKVSKGNSNYTWRLTDPSGKKVTKAGWLEQLNAATAVSLGFDEDSAADKVMHSFADIGTTTVKRDEADIQVNLDPTGFKSFSGTKRLRAYRWWELINSDTANIMIEPDFHWNILSGPAQITFAEDKGDGIDGGNSYHNWADVRANGGTSFIATYYDSIDVYTNSSADTHGTHGGLYPATNPDRTFVVAVTDETAGAGRANVAYNNNGAASGRSQSWDYIYDTWYYMRGNKNAELDFTVDNASGVSYAYVMTDKAMKSVMSDFKALTADASGRYHAPLAAFDKESVNYGGTVVIRMQDASGNYSYQMVRVAGMKADIANKTDPGEPLMPGDKAEITFEGLYRSVNKMAGIFNPTTFNFRYTAGDTETAGTLGQYMKMNNAVITVRIPDDIDFAEGAETAVLNLVNGYVYGSMYSAANPFSTIYEMTDTGVGTNFNAVTVAWCMQHMADIPVTVNRQIFSAVNINVNGTDDYSVTVKDFNGNEISAEDGVYSLKKGSYSYEIEADGFITEKGSFDVTKADFGGKTVRVTLRDATGAWDGETTSAAAADENNVYSISSAEELAWFAQQVNSGSGAEYNARLTADITLNNKLWTPIGLSTAGKQYKGTFDGNGHYINDLYCNGSGNQGLFGYGNACTIKDLGVRGEVISDKIYAAGILAQGTGTAKVTGCVNYASVTGAATTATANCCTGGVAGTLAATGTIKDCYNIGTVRGFGKFVGGLMGGNTSAAKPENCYNAGRVINTSDNATALSNTGSLGYTGTAANCYFLKGTTNGTNESRGTAVSAAELRGLAGQLGAAYGKGTIAISKGYPALTWQGICEHADMESHPAAEPTCVKAGNKAYWECADCATYFRDAEGTDEIEENSWVLEPDPEAYHRDNAKKVAAVPAQLNKNGTKAYWKCGECDSCFSDVGCTMKISKPETISMIKTINIPATVYTYTGKAIKPAVKSVKDGNGKVIAAANYTVSYQNGVKKVGAKKMTVTFRGGEYAGSCQMSYIIKPAKAKIVSVSGGRNKLTVKFASQKASGIDGYQIAYKRVGASKWKYAKTTAKATSKTIKKLAKNKKYRVKVRAYKKINGKAVYGAFSKVKVRKTK